MIELQQVLAHRAFGPGLFFSLGLVTAGVFDLCSRRIPNYVSISLLGAGLTYHAFLSGFPGALRGLLGAVVGIKRWGWHAIAKWHFDGDASKLTFSDPASPTVIADVRLVGSYSTKSNTFQWGGETFDEGAAEAHYVSRLRVFGEVRGISKLTTANWKCDEVDGWEMASIAGYLLGTEALYLAPMKHVQWFMLLSNLRHST